LARGILAGGRRTVGKSCDWFLGAPAALRAGKKSGAAFLFLFSTFYKLEKGTPRGFFA
jgi:hypothetical protein